MGTGSTRRARALAWLAAVALSLIFAAPLGLLALGSMARAGRPPPDGVLDLRPDGAGLTNYETALDLLPLGRQILNSLLVIAVAVPVTVLVAAGAGFAVVAASGRLRAWLVGITIAVALLPPMVLWVPRVVMLRLIGLGGETLAVAITAFAATSPLFVLLFALAFRRIPPSTLEAARCEGLSSGQVFWRAALPQVGGTTFAVAVLALVAHWGNSVEPTLLLTRPETQTAAIGIRSLSALEPTLYPIFLAASVLVTLPPVVAFILAQRGLFGPLIPSRK